MIWNKFFGVLLVSIASSWTIYAQNLKVNGKNVDASSVQLMEALAGEPVSLDHYKGQNGLLVIFTCNTCPFVVGKEGGFAGWEKDYNNIIALAKAKGYGTVLINSNEAFRKDVDAPYEMLKRAKEKKYLAPYIIDTNHQLADLLEAKTTPHVYLFDGDYSLIYSGAIDNASDPRAVVRENYLVNALVAEDKGTIVRSSKPVGCSIKRVGK